MMLAMGMGQICGFYIVAFLNEFLWRVQSNAL